MTRYTLHRFGSGVFTVCAAIAFSMMSTEASAQKPNILVIWGMGEHPFRTGMLTIGMPGSPQGIPDWAPTIADLLKGQGYATGQFGKNHLGDRDNHLPTVHGFDEFLGNLYHLNAEEEPETYYYPKDPEFKKKFGPRGVLHTWSDGKGGQRIEDTGPLSRARMPTVDLEIYDAANKFMDTQVKAQKPFFIWFNTTRMHVWTHLKPSAEGRTGIGLYPDGMVEHDDMVGALLKRLDDLGIANNTIVVYGTDNGAETGTWPDGGTMPFHGEKGTTWEGGFRVPMLVRWPGVIKPGTIVNEIFSQEDWLPTLLAAAGEPNIVEKVNNGYQANGNIATAVRDVPGWPVLVNLRADPYEKTPRESGMYVRWYADNIWLFVPVQEKLKNFLVTLPQFPFQQGSSLNAANINYNSIQAMQAMKRLQQLESLSPPGN